ncbi:MAG: hypothetical protein R3B48_02555 [Kofleriaceae bacterium]
MTASARGLALCAALLALLALAWWGRTPPTAPPPTLVTIEAAQVRRVGWVRNHVRELEVERRGSGWWVTRWVELGAARSGPAHDAVIEQVLEVLTTARWQRRKGGRDVRGDVELEVSFDARSVKILAGQSDQRWVLIGAYAYLVDAWVARALDPGVARVVDVTALPDATRAATVEAHFPDLGLELIAQGGRLVSPGRWPLEPGLWRAVGEALAALRAVPLPPRDDAEREPPEPGVSPTWSLRIAGGPSGAASLEGYEPCPHPSLGSAARSSRVGAACVDADELARLVGLLVRAEDPAERDRRPAAAEAGALEAIVVTAGGARLELVRVGGARWQGALDGRAFGVEEASALALAEILATPWALEDAPATGAREVAALTVRRQDGVELALRALASPGRAGAPPRLARDDEPGVFVVPPGWDLRLPALAARLAERAVWQVEPLQLERLSVDERRARRGAVVGEWLDAGGAPLPEARAALWDELASAVAALRAQAWREVSGPLAHRLRAELAAPPTRGAELEPPPLELELGRADAGCLGRVGGRGLELPTALCELVRELAR